MNHNDEEIKKKIEKKIFTKSSFVETQIWIYSSFSAISLAFFLGLLGANDNVIKDFFTHLSTYTYSISLATNACIVFIFSIFRDDGDLIYKLNLSSKINYIIWLSWISFLLSIIFTIGIFSVIAMIFMIIVSTIIFITFKQVQKDINREDRKKHELEMEKIRNCEINQ
jgi:membrane protein YdbS with pleckstrin-like domain